MSQRRGKRAPSAAATAAGKGTIEAFLLDPGPESSAKMASAAAHHEEQDKQDGYQQGAGSSPSRHSESWSSSPCPSPHADCHTKVPEHKVKGKEGQYVTREAWMDCVSSLPTKDDLAAMLSELKATYNSGLKEIKADISQLGHRVKEIEEREEIRGRTLHAFTEKINSHDREIETLMSQLDDYENRSRRKNLRIRGLPEAITAPNLLQTLQNIFASIMGHPEMAPLEVERAHRALRPKSVDQSKPRDVICKFLRFLDKEAILQKMRGKDYFDFDGAHLAFFPDLSRRTLAQRRALRPLLAVLQDRAIQYRWGFPFSLIAKYNGVTAILKSPADVEPFCNSLGLERVLLPDWKAPSALEVLAPEPEWTVVGRKRTRVRHSPGTATSPT